jgi:predicted secreted protein
MSLVLGLAIYFIIWWVCLFAVLPFGVRTQAEAGEVVQGTPESAPAAPRLKRVALITTGVATLVFSVVYFMIANAAARAYLARLLGWSGPGAGG